MKPLKFRVNDVVFISTINKIAKIKRAYWGYNENYYDLICSDLKHSVFDFDLIEHSAFETEIRKPTKKEIENEVALKL